MFARLTGTVERIDAEELILDVRGVGYRVEVPSGTFPQIRQREEPITLEIHTSVRDDDISLYGFLSLEEKRLFEEIISISRIGPRLGLSLLSAMSPGRIVRIVRENDPAPFEEVSGIGEKTANRLLLELRDRVDDLEIELPNEASPGDGEKARELRSALENLGYRASAINRAIDQLEDDIDGERALEGLVREALELL